MTPKIADFGIARMVSSQTMVYTSSVIGSVHYLSPEQAGGAPVTAQSDIYSLGIVLYEMLTGHVPFDGKTAVAVAMMHLEKKPRSLKEYNSELPDSLQDVIYKALAKDPADRYATAEEMWQDLYNLKNKCCRKVWKKITPKCWVSQLWPNQNWASRQGIFMIGPATAKPGRQKKPSL